MRKQSGKKSYSGRGSINLIEESFHLVRRLPLNILVFYFLGAVPFIVVFLFFWADMSHGPLAAQRVAEAALGVTLAYLWMKFWQTYFANRVREWITGEERLKWTAGRVLRVAALQSLIQPVGLVAKPLSLIMPFLFLAPVLSFFSTVSVDGARQGGLRKLGSRALAQSLHQPREVYEVVMILTLFGFFVWVNCITLIVTVPWLLQVLFAIDTEFMRSGWRAGNSTFLTAAFALSYLALDLLMKGIFSLRSYYWDARTTGEDLKVELTWAKRQRASARFAAVLVLLAACLIGGLAIPTPAVAAESVSESATLSVEELDQRLDRVLSQREYVWRLPRPTEESEDEMGLLRRFVVTIGERIGEIWSGVGRAVGRVLDWILEWLFRGDDARADERTQRDWRGGLPYLIVGLGVVLAGLIGYLLWQAWSRGRHIRLGKEPVRLAPKPDLEDENVTADALPVDEWSRLAAEYKAKGEFRLAMRAYYLASLAALAEAKLVVLARAKSNREYLEELARHAHDQRERVEAFQQNCRFYEQAWYGMYPVDNDKLARFELNQKRISRHEQVHAH